MSDLRIVPMTLRQANAYVVEHHRHHGPVQGCKFALGVTSGGELVGVALVGRPVSRALDDGTTLEIRRLCTDGTRNAPSFLAGASWRAARALGYTRLVTYTLPEEGGASLRGAGFAAAGKVSGRSWSCPSRPREDQAPVQVQDKLRWELAEPPKEGHAL